MNKKLKLFFNKFVVLSFIFLFLGLSLIFLTEPSKAFANSEYAVSSTTLQLSKQLKQFIKGAALGNEGLEYFMLPNPTDLSKIPADPKNPLTIAKVELGKRLFHEPALTINPINPKHWQNGSCATCHLAESGFRANLSQALGVGGFGFNEQRHRDPDAPPTDIDKLNILAPSVLNVAYQDIQPWDGRAGVTGPNAKIPFVKEFDLNRFGYRGLEALSIEALTVHRMGTAAIAQIPEYQELFAKAFPDRPYVKADVEDNINAGLAIAAYLRTLLPNESPFQKWLHGDESAMSDKELRGAKVFFSSTCIACHTGPNLASNSFAALGFADHPEDFTGLNLGRSIVTKNPSDDFKFKTPQLYNLADSTPYGHGASFNTLEDVVQYIVKGKPQNFEAKFAGTLSSLFKPLNISGQQVDDLTTFLKTSLRDPNLIRYKPKSLPSGLCFPNNDPESKQQLGCS